MIKEDMVTMSLKRYDMLMEAADKNKNLLNGKLNEKSDIISQLKKEIYDLKVKNEQLIYGKLGIVYRTDYFEPGRTLYKLITEDLIDEVYSKYEKSITKTSKNKDTFFNKITSLFNKP